MYKILHDEVIALKKAISTYKGHVKQQQALFLFGLVLFVLGIYLHGTNVLFLLFSLVGIFLFGYSMFVKSRASSDVLLIQDLLTRLDNNNKE
jgi:heme O synthase-like polyprenyltransferase